jgi:YfiH family protein
MTPFESALILNAIPTIRHGFFGRAGGVSEGEFAGLNVSWSVGDDPTIVDQNRDRIQNTIGTGPLAILKQVHSADVQILTQPLEPSTIEADALVTAKPGIALAILTADCTPILFSDPEAGIIGAAHAGWRGAVDGIIANTIAAMKSLGANPAHIRAAIGPTIHAPNYEVGDKFKADFLALHPGGEQFFHAPPRQRVHFDLPGFVLDQLRAAGISQIEMAGACTYAYPERYFSHRYATHKGGRTGRQMSVIGLTQV